MKWIRLLRYARPYRRGWASLALASVLSSAVALAVPWPVKLVVDHAIGDDPLPPLLADALRLLPGAGAPEVVLALAAAAGVVLYLAGAALDAFLSVGYVRFGLAMVHDLGAELFARLQRQSLRLHSQVRAGDALSRVLGDSWCVHSVVDHLLLTPARAIVVAAGVVFAMARLDPALALVAGASAPAMAAVALAFGRPLRHASRARRDAEGALQAHVQQALSGIRVVQAFGQEAREHERFVELSGLAVRAQQRAALLGNTSQLGTGLATALGTGAVLLFGANRVLGGTASVGTLLVFAAYLTSLQNQLKAIAAAVLALRTVRGQADRAVEILEREPEIRDRPGARSLPHVRGRVRVEAVTAGWVPGTPVLRGVTLEAAPGERVAVVGRSGAGKSTLASLVPRLCDPWEGRVTLDGHDLRALRVAEVRRSVAVVLQEPFLLPRSVAENIALGRPGAARAEIEAAARAAHADAFLEALPRGYDTVLAEGGADLSGGQRQRLAIARAFLKDAPVLVLDEPTSALDGRTEALVLDALERLMAGRTTLLVAHRLTTARRAARIVVLEDGTVLERGGHDELLRRGGAYARLWALQAGAAEAAPAAEAR